MPGARRRRRWFPIVDAHFQWKYTLIVTILGVGCTAVMGTFLYGAHRDNTRLLDLTGDPRLQEQVMRGDEVFLVYLLGFVLFLGIVLAGWGLIVTHRISGPVQLAARYLSVIAQGQYPDVRPLRKRDELQDFFKTLIDAVHSLRHRDLNALKEIDRALASAKRGLVPNADSATMRQALSDATTALQEQRTILAHTVGSGEGVSISDTDGAALP